MAAIRDDNLIKIELSLRWFLVSVAQNLLIHWDLTGLDSQSKMGRLVPDDWEAPLSLTAVRFVPSHAEHRLHQMQRASDGSGNPRLDIYRTEWLYVGGLS